MLGRAGGSPEIIEMVPLHEAGQGRALVVMTPAMKARAARHRGRQAGNAVGGFLAEVLAGIAYRFAHALLAIVSAVCALAVTPGAICAIIFGSIWGVWHSAWAANIALWSLGIAVGGWVALVTAKRVGIHLREMENGPAE